MGLTRGRVKKEVEAAEETPEVATTQEAPDGEQEQESMPFEGDEAEANAEEAQANAKAALAGKKPRSTLPAEANANTAVIPADHKPQNTVMAGLAEDGYEGLELGFGSFPILKLENEGIFVDTDENEYGKSFHAVIFPTRSKYVLKNTKCTPKEEEVYYSYDRVNCTDGTPLQAIIDEWAAEDWGYEIKHYLEAPAQIVGGDFDDEMVMLSVPPASRNKLSGYFYTNRMKKRGSADSYVTECFVGKKVTSTDHDFYPWKFKYVEQLEG